MKDLKFELTVLFLKFNLNVYEHTDLIKQEYQLFYGKEVTNEALNNVIGDMMNDISNNIIEIPDDYELNF